MSNRKAVVLVVEDNPLIRMCAVDLVLAAGFEALEAVDADEAIRILEARPDIHLVFTDVSMPGSMSGSDLAHQVAKRWPGVSIIMTSGRPRPEPLPLGAQFHAKPYEPTSVLRHAGEMTLPPG